MALVNNNYCLNLNKSSPELLQGRIQRGTLLEILVLSSTIISLLIYFRSLSKMKKYDQKHVSRSLKVVGTLSALAHMLIWAVIDYPSCSQDYYPIAYDYRWQKNLQAKFAFSMGLQSLILGLASIIPCSRRSCTRKLEDADYIKNLIPNSTEMDVFSYKEEYENGSSSTVIFSNNKVFAIGSNFSTSDPLLKNEIIEEDSDDTLEDEINTKLKSPIL